MFSSLPDLQKERGFPCPSTKKKLLKLKRESTCSRAATLTLLGQWEALALIAPTKDVTWVHLARWIFHTTERFTLTRRTPMALAYLSILVWMSWVGIFCGWSFHANSSCRNDVTLRQHARADAESTAPPLWQLDVRALGYTPPNTHEEGYTVPRVGPLGFVADKVIVTFVTRVLPNELPRRGQAGDSSLPLRLQALFLDGRTGELRTRREWPTASDRSRIAPAPGGNFVVITPDQLLLYSPDFSRLRELELSLSREAALTSLGFQQSPAGRYLLIDYLLPGGEEGRYRWVDLENLQPAGSWAARLGNELINLLSISDTGLQLGASWEGAMLRAQDGPWRLLWPHADGFGYIEHGSFVNDSTIFWWAQHLERGMRI